MTLAQFRRRFRFWQKKMLLADWKITLVLGPLEDDEECKADCEAKPEYREAVVRLNLAVIPDDEIDSYCIHELAHVVGWALEQQAENSAGEDEQKYDTVRFIAETVATKWEEIILNVSKP